MEIDLEGKVAIVTGAAGAIGRAISRRLAGNGARVVIADIDLTGAEAFAATLPGAMACHIDIADEASVAAGVAAILDHFGQIDILVNNAGINTHAHRVNIDVFPRAEWDRILRVDLDGTYLMSKAALAPMLARGAGGRIINIASVVGLAAMRLQSPFVAAKAGLIHLTRSMALELAPQGILVNAIAPGSVLSEGTRALFYSEDGSFAGRTAEFMAQVPMGRPGTPEEIAEPVLFLASPAAAYVNGQTLAVDGGWTAGYPI
ncbi:SDR family NAD(P)-dependent oxidoreductase [Oricola indica]|uniref:SDR family NAD(P)-dependent oxidoreductase n=1 Tax=Oricola indica TaxID=2872591 RepID=UPI003CCC111C